MTLYGKYRQCCWIAFVLVALVLCSKGYALDKGEGHASVPAQRVETQHMQWHEMTHRINVPGRWIAREEITVMAPVDSEKISDVLVDVGDRVQRGQPLVHLERNVLSAQLDQAQQGMLRSKADLAQTQASVSESSEALARARRLQPDGAISHQELEAAIAAYKTASAQQRQALAAVKQAQAQVDEARIRLSHANIQAPVSGLIAQRYVQTGSLINAQTPLFSLIREGELEFMAQVPASALAQLKVGMSVQLSTSDSTLIGHIRQVGATINPDNGYGEVRIAVSPSETSLLRSGLSGRACISLEQRQIQALDVRALRYASDGQRYVYIVGPDQRIKRVSVTTGWRDSEWIEIKSGLGLQDVVVLSGAALVAEGERVEVVSSAGSLPQRADQVPSEGRAS